MKTKKREVAEALARAHFDVEPNMIHVILLEPIGEKDPYDSIPLLEVVDGVLELGISPVAFSADPKHGIEYSSIIVEVSPKEYQDIQSGDLDIGAEGWKLGPELCKELSKVRP